VTFLQAWEKASRWVAAQHARAVVAVAGRRPADRDDFAREQVRMALVGMGGSPKACVDTARALTGPLRAAADALAAGTISDAHCRVLAQETAGLAPDTAADVAAAVLPAAGRQTPSQLRRAARRAVIKADPVAAETAEARATTQRHVTRRVEPDAQASLQITGPALDVMTIWTALDLHASLPTPADDTRTLDQRRFDALVTLARTAPPGLAMQAGSAGQAGPVGQAGPAGQAESAQPGRRRGLEPCVHVYADAATWAGLADDPVELDGYGPIPAGAARSHFTSSTWRAVVTDALTQRPLAVSDRTYRPSAHTRRLLHLRDRTCLAPGCTAPIWHCDADHNTPHAAGGTTDAEQCGLQCRRHHRMKTFTTWTWQRHPDDTVTWTSPTGHHHTRDPHRYPMPPRTEGDRPPEPADDPPF
jgi:hypothetical protein